MKKIKVRKGRHYPCLFKIGIFPMIYFKNFKIEKTFLFNEDSFFIFEGEDKFDYSKLFGISFLNHQKNESYRVGFRFINNGLIEICEYNYVNGIREIKPITNELLFNIKYTMSIIFRKNDKRIIYIIREGNSIIYYNQIKINKFRFFGYTLGLYIGGNNPAPKELIFYYD